VLGFEETIKAQVTQSLLTAILEDAGYLVSRLGVEERLREIKYLSKPEYDRLDLPAQLRLMPDLLVTAPDLSVAPLVEVKYRRELESNTVRRIVERLGVQFELWPGTTVVLFLSNSFWDNRGFIQDHVRAIRQQDLSMLGDEHRPMYERWMMLPMLHQAVPGLNSENYLTRSDAVAPMLTALARL
jgi:hypothetical protein